ncbi:MAG: PEP-CTERM sorting domain-containing protein [Pirellulales bacterium]
MVVSRTGWLWGFGASAWSIRRSSSIACLAAVLSLWGAVADTLAADLLVSDRLTNRILRYDASGTLLGTVVEDSVNLAEPNGMALSPDGTQLYVASRQNSQVVRYDFDGTKATNPQVFATGGLSVPASVEFAPGGQKILVSNLGLQFDGTTVAQLNLDGSSAGPAFSGGLPVGRTGIAIGPQGEIFVGSFQDGSILRLDTRTQTLLPFVAGSPATVGLGNLMTNGEDIYAVAGFGGLLMKFSALTGEPDPNWVPISGLEFPASLSLSPDGNGLLVGVLGFSPGAGKILRYGFDGKLVGTFATSQPGNPALGFVEATGMLVSPALRQPLICGDTDADRDVDSSDLATFISNWTGSDPGTARAPFFTGGDCDLDGDVDSADLASFLENWTGAQSAGRAMSAVAVPEPTSLLMLGLGSSLAVLGAVRRAERRRV